MRAFLSEFVLTKMKNMHKLQVEGRSQENTTLWELSLTKIEKWATKPYHNLVIHFIRIEIQKKKHSLEDINKTQLFYDEDASK